MSDQGNKLNPPGTQELDDAMHGQSAHQYLRMDASSEDGGTHEQNDPTPPQLPDANDARRSQICETLLGTVPARG